MMRNKNITLDVLSLVREDFIDDANESVGGLGYLWVAGNGVVVVWVFAGEKIQYKGLTDGSCFDDDIVIIIICGSSCVWVNIIVRRRR